jgi:hypothetical protein
LHHPHPLKLAELAGRFEDKLDIYDRFDKNSESRFINSSRAAGLSDRKTKSGEAAMGIQCTSSSARHDAFSHFIGSGEPGQYIANNPPYLGH